MKSILKRFIPGILLAALLVPAKAQSPSTMYFMPGVPQSNRINPAIQPGCGFYLGFPGLAPLRMQVSTGNLSIEDLVFYNAELDSLVTFLHPLADREAFLDQLDPVNYLVTDLSASLASFGFRAGKNFISVDVTARVDGSVSYPSQMFNLVMYGLGEGQTVSLDGLGMDLQAFDEVSLGWSRSILPNLDVGARGKVLFGIGSMTSTRSELQVTASEEAWNIQSDMRFNASFPFADITYGEEGFPDSVAVAGDLSGNFDPGSIPRYVFNFNNLGLGLDVGVNYRPFPELRLSASVLDLGYIRWEEGVHEVALEMDYDFEGIEVNPFQEMGDPAGEILDSLQQFVNFSSGQPFTSRLNTKILAGVAYYPIEKIGFGVLSRTDLLGETVAQRFTGSANLTTGRFINLSLSYTYSSYYAKNLGAGISFNAGPFNLYLISDNALNTVFWPHQASSMNLWFGLNLCFGYKKDEKPEYKDKPLIL